MQVLPISLIKYNNFQPQKNDISFGHRGQPITLKYAIEKRAHLIPERVLSEAKELLAKTQEETKSLLDIHKAIYAPLLECKTLEEAKKLFPEFKDIKPVVVFERNSKYSREFKEKAGENFSLKMLQDFWANLKTQTEIAEDLGMKNRTSLAWALEKINFVSYEPNYKVLLRSSDAEGNRLIASKTTAWNAAHPDLMYAHNKKAAQACKTEKYRVEQRDRMKEYDKLHPERREKIGRSTKNSWDQCPEVKKAMSEYASTCPVYIRQVIMKQRKGMKLNENEKKICNSFFKNFWDKHPEMKEAYTNARRNSRA